MEEQVVGTGILHPKALNRWTVEFHHDGTRIKDSEALTLQAVSISEFIQYDTINSVQRLEIQFEDDLTNRAAKALHILKQSPGLYDIVIVMMNGEGQTIEEFQFKRVSIDYIMHSTLDYASSDTVRNRVVFKYVTSNVINNIY